MGRSDGSATDLPRLNAQGSGPDAMEGGSGDAGDSEAGSWARLILSRALRQLENDGVRIRIEDGEEQTWIDLLELPPECGPELTIEELVRRYEALDQPERRLVTAMILDFTEGLGERDV